MKVARIYESVSTLEQDLTRQADIENMAMTSGFYIAGIYREKASGASALTLKPIMPTPTALP